MSNGNEAWAPAAPAGISGHVDTFTRDNLPPPSAQPQMNYSSLPELTAYPPQMNCASWLLDRQAASFGNRPVLLTDDETWSYNALLEKANRIANVLVEDMGIRPGNRILLRSPNNPFYVACWFAAMKAGAVVVATMPLLRQREISHIIETAEIDVALCDQRLSVELEAARQTAPRLRQVIYFNAAGEPDSLAARMANKSSQFENIDTSADDVCLIAFTSGTTGPPKGCMHFHRDILAICDTFSRYILKPGPEDIFAGSPPLAFTFGLGSLVAFPMHVGAATLMLESYTPESMLAAIARHKVSILTTAPTMYRALTPLVERQKLASLKKCVSAGETLPRPTYEGWLRATGIKAIDGIGATEMLHIFIASAGDDIRPGATGLPVPGYEARVVDDNGQPVPDGDIGRLAVRGPTGCRYLDNPERQMGYVSDGWNYTGDVYIRDGEGYFHYQARTDDMIISAGYNISGPEVEAVLLEHEAVAECAVVGTPDAQRGEIVKAYVVLRDTATADAAMVKALQDHVKATVAPYKYPRAIEFIELLPKTQTGKIQRFVLRQKNTGQP